MIPRSAAWPAAPWQYPSVAPAAYSIAHRDVVDLAGKTRSGASAAQHLSDCFQTTERAGQFLSVSRSAKGRQTSARLHQDDGVVLARVVQQHAGALIQHVG